MDFIHELYSTRQNLKEADGVFNFLLLKDQEGGIRGGDDGEVTSSIPVHRFLIQGKTDLDLETIKEFKVPQGIGKRGVETFIKFLYLEELDEEIGRDEGYNLLLLSILTKMKYKYGEKLANLTYDIRRRLGRAGRGDSRDPDDPAPAHNVSIGGRNDEGLGEGSGAVENARGGDGGVLDDNPVNGHSSTEERKRKRQRLSTFQEGLKPLEEIVVKCSDSEDDDDNATLLLKDMIAKAKDGDTIPLLPAVYEISSPIEINLNNLIIQGAEVNKTVLKDTRRRGTERPLFLVKGDGLVMRNLKIVSPVCETEKISTNPKLPFPPGLLRPAIHIDSSSCLVEHVRFENCSTRVTRSKNILRNLNFYAEKTLNLAISIRGSNDASVPPANVVRDVEIHNYETGVWLSDTQGRNQICNVKTTEVERAVIIASKAHHNEINNLEYKCPSHALTYGKDAEGSQAIIILHGATNNVVDGLRCFGFQKGMRVRSIFVGTIPSKCSSRRRPHGNVVKNWKVEKGIKGPIICDDGDNNFLPQTLSLISYSVDDAIST